jgi:hypothetical protein
LETVSHSVTHSVTHTVLPSKSLDNIPEEETVQMKDIPSSMTIQALPKNSMSLSNIASTTGEILKPLAKPLTQVKRSYKYKLYMTHNESY